MRLDIGDVAGHSRSGHCAPGSSRSRAFELGEHPGAIEALGRFPRR